MPCFDSRSNESRVVYRDGVDPAKLRRLENDLAGLEAALCAVFSELERRDIASEVAASASRSGLINLMTFWSAHSKSDESRIASELHSKFSKDEQAIIKKLLNDD